MTTCVALLRAVNVGGRSPLAMTSLRAFVAGLGLENPRTLLQSGNVVFGAKKGTPASLETLLEREAASRLSLETEFFLRTAAEWSALVDANPFPDEASADPSHLIMMCLKTPPSAAGMTRLAASIKGRERVSAVGRQLYVVYPDGIGRSKLTGALVEKVLSTRGTARNWNTVLKLAALAAEA